MKLGHALQQCLSVPPTQRTFSTLGDPITLVIISPSSMTLSMYRLTPLPFILPLRSVFSQLSAGVSNRARSGIQT